VAADVACYPDPSRSSSFGWRSIPRSSSDHIVAIDWHINGTAVDIVATRSFQLSLFSLASAGRRRKALVVVSRQAIAFIGRSLCNEVVLAARVFDLLAIGTTSAIVATVACRVRWSVDKALRGGCAH
jgi:hypothetical protein